MLKNYFKIAFRNLLKNKSHTFINISGLSLGVISALVIFLFVQHELSYETFHTDGDRIYRVVRQDFSYGTESFTYNMAYPLAEAVRNDVIGVEYATLINDNFGAPVLSYFENGTLQKKFVEEDLVLVDPDFFEIFDYTWLLGNPKQALSTPNSAVITEHFAEKMFGTTNVLGKTIHWNGSETMDMEITGLVKDMPEHSDFQFIFFGASNSKGEHGDTFARESWNTQSSGWQTFLKLKPNVSEEAIQAQFDPMIEKYRDAQTAEEEDYLLQPLSELHYDARFGNYSGRIIEKKTLASLGVIGFLLLLAACINFINLNTAISAKRSKEVGMRKTLGATKSQLTFHFLGETALLTFIALSLGTLITQFILPFLEPLFGFELTLNVIANWQVLLFLLGLFISITVLAGWYPSRHLSGFNPIQAMKNKINASYSKGLTLRRSLIITQFTITQILIIGTIVIAAQVTFFQNYDIGFNKEAIVEVDILSADKQAFELFRNQLSGEPGILNLSFSNTGTTSNSSWGSNYYFYEDTSRIENNTLVKLIDENFVDTYGVTILAGHNLVTSDTIIQYMVSETFANQVGYGDDYQAILGKIIRMSSNEAPIVGVVKNFNTSSLHNELEPVVISSQFNYSLAGIKINMNRSKEALTAIQKAYEAAFPDYVFDYHFLDDHIADMYESEQRTARIMNAFTIIAILIGSLGLFGLVSYMATTRTKEIGVRKVLGASMVDILKIFSGELSLLLGVSFVIAAPAAWFFMQKWLADYAYRIDIGIGIFALALTGTIAIAVLTVGYKATSSALANPVESLKSE